MDRDRMEGRGKEATGAVKEQAGEWTDNEDLERDGTTDRAEGEAQGAWGKVKDAAGDAKDAVTDKLDR